MTTATRPRPTRTKDRYAVEFVPIGSITPSPENDQVYGEIQHDEAMGALIDSIRRKGLDEPILLTEDRFILSGHRRYYAVGFLGWKEVPVRVKEESAGKERPISSRLGRLQPAAGQDGWITSPGSHAAKQQRGRYLRGD